MPSEAEIGADKMCQHCRGTGQPNGIMGGPEHGLCSWCKGTGRAAPDDISFYRALSAASAVRSEGVAWRSDMRLDVFEVDPSEPDGRRWKWKTILSQVPPIEGKGVIFRNITPLYTSPVQTREDGALRRLIRNLPSIIEDHACGGSDTRPVVDIDGLVGALTENVAALLSQPEPKGDK
jgi:hypothetical protein